MADSVNSTNEQFEAVPENKSVFRKTKKLERKPLIGERVLSSSNGLSTDNSSVGRSTILGSTEAGHNVPANTENSSHNNASNGSGGSGNRTLKTADGVFAPVALSQFSSLLFLRIGYLVGNGGISGSLALLTGAYGILVFTVLSICAISTNGAVEGGGAYFMISRTLGPEMGGAIGIVFYIANVFSCALYTSGCVEGLLQGISIALYPDSVNGTNVTATSLEISNSEQYLISLGINLVLLCLCLIGAKMFAKCTSAFFYTVSGIAVLMFFALMCQRNIVVPYARSNHLNTTEHSGNFTGPSLETARNNLKPDFGIDYTNNEVISTMSLFSVLFSGVTGIMAGANMSGELKDPGYSIPRGTLWALVFTYLVYVCLFVATGVSTTREVLLNNYLYMSYISFWKPLVYLGIVLATLCASLSNMIGASRIMRAIAADKVFGPAFNFLFIANRCKCSSCCQCLPQNEYLGPLLFTFFLTGGVLGIGDMNSIAPFASVFFLLSYAMLNVSCMMLTWASAPNFRPKFKTFSITTCSFGLISTIIMMIILNRKAAFACMGIFALLLISLYFYHLKYPSDEMQWGSVAQAVLFHTVRKYLLKLDFRREHVKFWRPHILLLVSNPRSTAPLIDTLNDIKKSGIYILGHVQVTNTPPKDLSEEYNRWQELVDHLKVKAFISITESPSVRQGALQIVRVSGLGALKPNTVMMGFRDSQQSEDFLTSPNSRYLMKSSNSSVLTSNWHPLEDGSSVGDGSVSSVSLTNPPGTPSSVRASPASHRGYDDGLSVMEYVALMQDILNCGKNLALCRNFHLLNKEQIAKRRNQGYIDVWPFNFLCPDKSRVDDTTSLFTLQLGTILNMVKFWRKNTGFRVFLIVPHEWDPDLLSQQKKKVRDTLAAVRINATIEAVPWIIPSSNGDDGANSSQGSGDIIYSEDDEIESDDTSLSASMRGSKETSWLLKRLTASYLSSVNRIIRQHSKEAAITFINLPPPPNATTKYPAYMDALTELSNNIGPSVLVHGLSKVTTTML